MLEDALWQQFRSRIILVSFVSCFAYARSLYGVTIFRNYALIEQRLILRRGLTGFTQLMVLFTEYSVYSLSITGENFP